MKMKITPMSTLHEGSVRVFYKFMLFNNTYPAPSNIILSKTLLILNYTQ